MKKMFITVGPIENHQKPPSGSTPVFRPAHKKMNPQGCWDHRTEAFFATVRSPAESLARFSPPGGSRGDRVGGSCWLSVLLAGAACCKFPVSC